MLFFVVVFYFIYGVRFVVDSELCECVCVCVCDDDDKRRGYGFDRISA
jgi:hypothetical protein